MHRTRDNDNLRENGRRTPGKPQLKAVIKIQRSDIHQPAHHSGSRFRANNSGTRAAIGRNH